MLLDDRPITRRKSEVPKTLRDLLIVAAIFGASLALASWGLVAASAGLGPLGDVSWLYGP